MVAVVVAVGSVVILIVVGCALSGRGSHRSRRRWFGRIFFCVVRVMPLVNAKT